MGGENGEEHFEAGGAWDSGAAEQPQAAAGF